MSMLHNNENDVPVYQARPASKLTSKVNVVGLDWIGLDGWMFLTDRMLTRQQSFRSANDGLGKAEKRPRGLKPQTSRRAVLGDVTNKMSIKKSTTMSAMSMGHAKKKPSYTYTSRARAMAPQDSTKIPTTPVVNTLESLELRDQPSPMCIAPGELRRLSTLQEEEENAEAKACHDIDSVDRDDPTTCWQYAEDITKYHLSTEKSRMPSPTYMSRQADINSKMRAILIDWLVDVHCKYDLLPQTLHIAVNLIDRHLEKDLNVPRQRLQLVGVTALFIASKYEEVYPPEAEDFVRITDNAYTRDEVFEMEVDILSRCGYRVTFPTAYQFTQRFLKASRTVDDRVENFAHYVIDRSLQEYKMIKYPPSAVGAAAVQIARTQMNDLPAWTATLEHHSTYTESSLSDCIEDLKEMLWNAQNGVGKTSKLTAVRRKFEKERFMAVSKHPLVFEEGL
ncbi:TPA: hypothetical protein N0F65_002616 [Lagenidium giganteum]|uniref:Cyclin N-terminal domain-containing protein n=1 Tax=Lagenidium giganteum TaxID=4803 RepID=A0AAV2YZ95_9STRA|nr:TPA: hypothetical protein N0F65_002616 [Lagenidium giganteum]